MTSAIAPCAPMASIVTRAPSSASRSRRSGMAAISFDLPATASCPSTRRWRVAQAETRGKGSRPLLRAWLRREVLPSMAMRSGSASRRPSPQLTKQALNSPGSSGDHLAQRVVARPPVLAGQEATEEGEVLVAPERDLDDVIGPRQGGAQQQEEDLRQRVEHLGLLPRVLERREVVEQERAIGLGHGRPPCDGAPTDQNRAGPQTYLPFTRSPCGQPLRHLTT